MATTTEHNSSRRALLAAGLGGLAATVAQSIGQPALVRAGVDGDVILGVANSASSTTGIASSGPGAALETSTSSSTGWAIIANSTDYPAVFASSAGNAGVYGVGHGSNGAVLGQSLGTGPGVLGSAGVNHTTPPTGTGIFGYGSQGVVGQGDGLTGYVGVQGFVGAPDPPPPAPLTGNHPTGTYGEANGADPTGVWGQGGTVDSGFSTGVYGEGDTGVWGYGGWGVFGASDTTGTGVYGFAGTSVPGAPANTGVFGYSNAGTGIYASSGTGTALHVNGKLRLSRSGKISVSSGKTNVVKTLAGVTTSSIIIAVLQTAETGTWVRAAVAGTGKFTVYFNRALPSSSSVGYMVLG